MLVEGFPKYIFEVKIILRTAENVIENPSLPCTTTVIFDFYKRSQKMTIVIL